MGAESVGAVLEGSVRRLANTVYVTAQLINAVTGFHGRRPGRHRTPNTKGPTPGCTRQVAGIAYGPVQYLAAGFRFLVV
jgi:hypothetical protein